MKDNSILKILARYLNHQSDAAEVKKVEAWYNHELANTDFELDDVKREQLREGMKQRINQEIKGQRHTLRRALLMVASVILLFLSFIFYFSINPVINTSKYVTRKADVGKNVIIQLSDSSTVTLNGGSEIRYPERFSKNERKIYLITGEAFFEVKRNPKSPFVVESGKLITKVLGTKFNISYYNFLDKIAVTVASGKVKVSRQDSLKTTSPAELFLLPNQQAVFNKTTEQLVKNNVDANKVKGWIDGQFYFDNERLANIVEALKLRFNKQIVFENEALKEYRVSLGFTRNDSFEKVISAIKKANKLTSAEHSGKVVLATEL